MLRLRVLNAIACVLLIVFNAMLSVWPMVGMNTVLVAINVWFIVRMLRERHDESAFEVLEVAPPTSTRHTRGSTAPTSSSSTGLHPRPLLHP